MVTSRLDFFKHLLDCWSLFFSFFFLPSSACGPVSRSHPSDDVPDACSGKSVNVGISSLIHSFWNCLCASPLSLLTSWTFLLFKNESKKPKNGLKEGQEVRNWLTDRIALYWPHLTRWPWSSSVGSGQRPSSLINKVFGWQAV